MLEYGVSGSPGPPWRKPQGLLKGLAAVRPARRFPGPLVSRSGPLLRDSSGKRARLRIYARAHVIGGLRAGCSR